MDYKEITAKTVEDAITQACLDLGVTSDRLDFEVLSEGSKGFFGIGNKPAVIRYRKIEEEVFEEEPAPAPVFEKRERRERPAGKAESAKREETAKREEPAKKAEPEEPAEKSEVESVPEKKENSGQKKNSRNRRNRNKKDHAKKDRQPAAERKPAKEIIPVDRSAEEIERMTEDAADFLKKVFSAMDLPAEIKGEYERETNCLSIEIAGDDMGILIGKRGQTLDSLQYLTSLCVNKHTKEYVRVKIDTEDYRRRRKETLENLAKNIASKVKKTGKAVVLEPMNPYERRIIHSALQPNNYVETYSEGNEPYRHVVVTPKK